MREMRSRCISLIVLGLAAAGCGGPKNIDDVQVGNVKDIMLRGYDIAGPKPHDNEVTISDQATIDKFIKAFQHRTRPTAIASDKADTVEFELKRGDPIKFEFGQATILNEYGSEVFTALRPYLTND